MKIKFTLVTIALIIMAILAFYIGHFPITKEQYMQILSFSQDSSLESIKTILYEVRFPRILSAIIVGASLSVAGAVYQGVFVNPLVSPGILGVLSGASFGAAIGMMIGQNLFFIQIFAFIFGFIAVILALILARLYGKSNTILMLVLGGVISSSLFGSLLSLIKYVADPYNTLPSIVYWLMGSFASTSLSQALTILPIMLFSIIILTLFSKHINILSLGDDDAKTLGVDVTKIRLLLIFFATLLSAMSVMICGVIGWVGLVVPHIARFIVGANHLVLIPFCAIFGGLFLLIVDTVSRACFASEIPIGILTSLIGIPVFIFVLRARAKNG